MSYIATGTSAQDALINSGQVGPIAPFSLPEQNRYTTFGYKQIGNQEELTSAETLAVCTELAEALRYGAENQVIRSAQQLNTRGIGTGFLSPLANALELPYLSPLNLSNYSYLDMAQRSRYMLNGSVPLDLSFPSFGSRY